MYGVLIGMQELPKSSGEECTRHTPLGSNQLNGIQDERHNVIRRRVLGLHGYRNVPGVMK